MTRPAPSYRPMTEVERRMARALLPGRVSYVPGSFDKRFGGTMAAVADSSAPEITERQAALLRVFVWRYRRQLPEAIRALQPVNPNESEAQRTRNANGEPGKGSPSTSTITRG